VALFIMDADGGNVRLVPDTHGAAESSWSPDGRRLAVTRTIVDDDRNLFDDVYIVNADGSGSRRLTTTGTAAGRPAWSPAGDRIAYTDRDVTSGDLDIYVLSADGPGAPVNLTNNDDSDFAPAWSPDGSRIAFNASRSGAEGIYVMNAADGTRQTAVTNGSDVSPAWSPDGGRLAFMRFVDGLPDLFLVDAAPPAAGTLATPVNLTNSPTVREQFPSWGGAAGPRYAFGGFRAPVDPAPAVNVARAGSAIPVKFSLGADYGLAIFKPGYPRFTSSVCGGGTQAPVETTVSADTRAGLTYDAATGVYTYVWKTDRALAGQCGTLDLGLNDGSSASAIFQFTR
jgi:dipeptidyl aminopeptidase/acylaminoacyl peptidase